MVHFTQYGSCNLFDSVIQVTASLPLDYSIRSFRHHQIFAPPPDFSQLITTFFAFRLPGIRHKPIFAWPYYLFRFHPFLRTLRTSSFVLMHSSDENHTSLSRRFFLHLHRFLLSLLTIVFPFPVSFKDLLYSPIPLRSYLKEHKLSLLFLWR